MAECSFSPQQIREKIEDNVAKLALDTRLFERVGNVLIPTIDDDALVNSALQYKDDVKIAFYKDLLSSNTRGVLQEISNQYYGRTETGDASTFGTDVDINQKVAIESFGQPLIDIATKVYPLTTSPSHGEVRGDINRKYADEVIKKESGLYKINIPQDIVNEALKVYNSKEGNERIRKTDDTPISYVTSFQDNVHNFTAYLSRKFATSSNIINDSSEKWAAKINDGKVTINTAYADYSDVWHEFSHPLLISMRLSNKELFDNLYNSLKTTDEWAEIKKIAENKVKRLYPEYKNNIDDFKEEVLATAIGLAAGQNTSLTSKFLNLFRQLIDWIAKLLNLDGASSVYIREIAPNMSFSDFLFLVQDENIILRPEKGWQFFDPTLKGAEGSFLREVSEYNKIVRKRLTPFIADKFIISERVYKPRKLGPARRGNEEAEHYAELARERGASPDIITKLEENRNPSVYDHVEDAVKQYFRALQPDEFRREADHIINSMANPIDNRGNGRIITLAEQGNPVDISSDYIRKLQGDPNGKTQLDKPFSSSTASAKENEILKEFYDQYTKEIEQFFKGKSPKSIDNKRLLNKYIKWLADNYPVSWYLTQPQQYTYGLGEVIDKNYKRKGVRTEESFVDEEGFDQTRTVIEQFHLRKGYEVLIANKYLLNTGHTYKLVDEQGNRLRIGENVTEHEGGALGTVRLQNRYSDQQYNATGWYIFHELYGDIPLLYEYQSDVIDDLDSLKARVGIGNQSYLIENLEGGIRSLIDRTTNKLVSADAGEFDLLLNHVAENKYGDSLWSIPDRVLTLPSGDVNRTKKLGDPVQEALDKAYSEIEESNKTVAILFDMLGYVKNINSQQRNGYISKLRREGNSFEDLVDKNILRIEEIGFILNNFALNQGRNNTMSYSLSADNGANKLQTIINILTTISKDKKQVLKYINSQIVKELNKSKELKIDLYYLEQVKQSGLANFNYVRNLHRKILMERIDNSLALIGARMVSEKIKNFGTISWEEIKKTEEQLYKLHEEFKSKLVTVKGESLGVDLIKQLESMKAIQLRFFIEQSLQFAKSKGHNKVYLPTAQFIDEVESGDPWTLYVTPWDREKGGQYKDAHLGSFYEALLEVPDITIEYKKVDGLTKPVLEVDISKFNKPVERFSKIDSELTEDQTDILFDNNRLNEEAGIQEGETPLQFMEKFSVHQEQVKQFLKANPNIKIEWGDEFSVFDQNANIISMSLSELYEISVRSGIPFKTVIGYYIMHEMAHAASYYAMKKGNNDKLPTELLNLVREFHKTQPFEDQMRQGFVEEDGLPYSMKDIDEFVADAFGNPFFQEYLKNIPYKDEGRNLWQKLVDWVLSLFGAKRDSVYDKVVDYINSSKVQRDNLEGMLTPDWVDMQVYYRGNPRDYISATYEYFTSSKIKDEVEEIFKKLPASMAKLKALEKLQNDPLQRGKIQSLLNAFNEIKGKESTIPIYINMLIQASRMAKDIEDQMSAAGKMEDGMGKITILNSLLTSAQNLEFITPLVTDILTEMNREGFDNIPGLVSFIGQIKRITDVQSRLKGMFTRLVTPSIVTYFSSLFPENEAATKVRDQIEEYRVRLNMDDVSDRDKKFFEDKIKKLQEEMMKMPTKETFEKIFSGQYEDASSMQAWLEAPALNSHPLIASTFYLLRSMDIQTSQDMLNTENDHDKKFRKVVSTEKLSLRDPRETWSKITNSLTYVIDVNDDGSLSTAQTRMLASAYQPGYLAEHLKFSALEDFYKSKAFEAKRNGNDDDYDRYYGLYEAQTKARQAFQKENSERRYLDEVYDMYALLDKQIALPDGKYTTFRKERGDIFRELEELENKRNQATTVEDQKAFQDDIRTKGIELKELRSIYNKDGSKKEGVPLAITQVANEYFDLRGKYGQSIITPDGQASFDRTMLYFKDQLDKGFMTKDQYDAAINDATVTELEDEYFEKINEFSELIQEATDQLTAIPEIKAILGAINRDIIKEGYKKIKTLTQAFRDNDGVIDGSLFSRVRPELVVQIRDIQQELENLKNKASRLKGLSVEETIELDNLTTKEADQQITSEEYERATLLRNEAAARRIVYKRNKSLIDGYYELIKGLSELIDSSNSEYYIEEVDNQLNKIIAQLKEDIKKEVQFSASLEDGNYFRRDDKWYKIVNRDLTTGETEIKEIKTIKVDDKEYTAIDQIVDEVAKVRSHSLLESSQWWKDNHYTYYGWDKETNSYFPQEKPIYIWVKTLPKNKEYVKAGQPSWKYKTYTINEGYINPKHSEIHPYVPINKANKFVNDDYFALQKSNPALFNYLEFLRTEYHAAQAGYPPEKSMGDILPSIVATEDELKVIGTKGLLLKSTYQKLFNMSDKQDETTSEDTKMLLGKSQSNVYTQRRILPTRFTGRIPIEKQSADVPAMILAFTLGVKKYTNLQKIHPLLESVRTLTDSLPVQEVHNFGKKFSFRNMMAAIKGETVKQARDKQTEKSNLSKTMDFVLDTFMYGQTKNPSVSTIMGMDVDWQVASRNIKKLASFALFSLKPFIAIKNTLSNKVQAVINSNIGKGFYTKTDYATAQWKVKNYIGNLISDYKKFGDKSFIGQALEYFQVLHGTSFNAYGRRTQWTEIKNTFDYLSIMKNISEFEVQITQFLAMASANKIMVDGKESSLLDGFELDKNKNFAMKSNVTTLNGKPLDKKQLDAFIMKVSWINRNINGAYRQDEKNIAQKTVLGDLAFYLNGYVFPGLYNRYFPMRYSIESQQITKGYWRQSVGFLVDLAKYRRGLNKQWADLRPEEKLRVFRFLKELGSIVGLFLLGLALGSGDDKKELKKNSPFHNYMLALAMTVKSETETFFPTPYAGFNEISRKINSPFAALRQISLIIQTMDNATKYVFGDDAAFYKKTGIHDGFHDRGDAKVVANFLKIIGWSGYELDPLEKLGSVRRSQQIR